MPAFVVTVIEPKNRASGIGDKLIETDDFSAAQETARRAVSDKGNVGRLVRFYNFAMFAGGMTDTLVTPDLHKAAVTSLRAIAFVALLITGLASAASTSASAHPSCHQHQGRTHCH